MTSHMIDGPYAGSHDARDRRQDYPSQPYTLPPGSPPSSSSPFAFNSTSVSNPNSSRTAPTMPSEQIPAAADYYQRPAVPGAAPNGGASYPNYAGSHPMAYRSNSETTRAPPPAPLARIPTYAMMQQANSVGQPSPTATSPYYQASPRGPTGAYSANSPRTTAYSQNGYYSPGYGQAPQALDMPRSLSYPNYTSNPYNSYLPSISSPALLAPGGEQLPSLARQHSTNSISTMGQAVYGGQYNRITLQDRPFKCDQCVQSFNRNHDLKRHKRIHLSVKPFGCEKCGKTFSRKDALRRHWMVRGCRGDEGATAPITPNFPLNNPPPALSPSTPPANGDKSTAVAKSAPSSSLYGSNAMSFSHPQAPPPLTSLPPRQSSDQPSQIILTPNDMAAQQRSASDSSNNGESVVIDPALSMEGGAFGGSNGPVGPDSGDKSYFELMRKQNSMGGAVPDSAVSSTFSRYGASPKEDNMGPARHHPYRRTGPLPSPSTHSPLAQSFAHQQQANPNLLAPINSTAMSKQSSADSVEPQWSSQRWS